MVKKEDILCQIRKISVKGPIVALTFYFNSYKIDSPLKKVGLL